MATRDDIRAVAELTELMHKSNEPFWVRLRYLLTQRGVPVPRSILAACFPDDTSFEFGIVICPDRRVFQFGFDYLGKTIEVGEFSEWEELTQTFEATPSRDYVIAGYAVLDQATRAV